jgi:hypothetical protein
MEHWIGALDSDEALTMAKVALDNIDTFAAVEVIVEFAQTDSNIAADLVTELG